MQERELQFLRLNSDLDAASLHEQFLIDGRVQVRDFLEKEPAERLTRLLMEKTPWGFAWQAGNDGPHRLRGRELETVTPEKMQAVQEKLHGALQSGEFGFVYAQYSASAAAGQGWSPSRDHDLFVAELNHPTVLDFVRKVTGAEDVAWCDAQVTHFGPTHFLSLHQDGDKFQGDNRRVAYVLNLPPFGWRPDWGGYLNFFDVDGDIIHGYAPRFNSLNMFRVPRHHNVSYVPPFAAAHRLAVTGWFRSGSPDDIPDRSEPPLLAPRHR